MRKTLCLLLAVLMMLASIPAMADGFTAGTYTGEAKGMYPLKVAVTLSADKIESVEIVENNETPAIGGVVLETLPAQIVAAQSTQIDVVAGATITCNAVFEAVNMALESAGVDPASLTPVEVAVDTAPETLECDLAIIGAGGAGMTAAIKAHDLGLNVIILEKQAFVGGATALSGGSALACGTRIQAEQGVEDSPELCMTDLLRVGEYENDATPTWLLSKYSGAAIDWLHDEVGVLFKESVGSASAEYSVGRARSSAAGSGGGLALDLLAKVEERNVPVMLNTRAYEITAENGVINGVLARDVITGKEYTVKSSAVLIATGGYCFSDEYIDDVLKTLPCSGSKANTGDGIAMALPHGAVLQNMDMVAVAGHGIRKGDSAQHTQGASKAAYRTTGTMLVNLEGKRFANESGTHASLFGEMKKQGRVFMIMDQAAYDAYIAATVDKYFTSEQLAQWEAENGSGVTVFAHGDTIEEVCATVGMNAEGLKAEIAKFTEFVNKGVDEDFGRAVSIPLSAEGPYYLVEQCLRYSTTMGGLTINADLQLVDGLNQPIPGLYAAGEVIGGVFGKNFPPSSGVGWALTSGMLAGESIAEALAE